MDQDWTLPGVSRSDIGGHEQAKDQPVKPRRTPIAGRLLSLVVALVAIGAIAATAWVYSDTKREILRLSTDIAQLRVSLDLYSHQQPGAAVSSTSSATPAGTDIQDLKNRLAILESTWRSQTPSAGATTDAAKLPSLPGETPATTTATGGAASGDCMPVGTRMLVTTGDSYPVCGSTAKVDVASVGPGDVALTDGTIVPTGGNSILKGTKCTLAVLSSGEDGMDGYAEVRVNC